MDVESTLGKAEVWSRHAIVTVRGEQEVWWRQARVTVRMGHNF